MVTVDTDSVRSMYDDHSASLFAYLARRLGREFAEDLLAETFRAAIDSYPRFDPTRGSERAWLFGIATNLLRRHWRTERRRLLALERSASMTARAARSDPPRRAATAPSVRPCRRSCSCRDRSRWICDSPGHPQY